MISTGGDLDATQLTEVVSRLRRVLRASIRNDYPWESRPMAQVELLQCLQDQGGARVGELASLLRLAPNTISVLVQQLVDARLADRHPDPADRRAVLVLPTPAGEHELYGWQQAHQRRLAAALTRQSQADRQAIAAALPALTRLVDHLDDGRATTAAGPGHPDQPTQARTSRPRIRREDVAGSGEPRQESPY